MKFDRQTPPRSYKHWRYYRRYTRQDFRRTCAYCFRHEDEIGGEGFFDQDHFQPRCVNPHRRNDYFNLYWCCVDCNRPNNKGSKWPMASQIRRGEIFCDPCEHDPFGTDYKEMPSGRLDPLSPAGKFTIKHIRLNDRSALVCTRLERRRVRITYLHLLHRLQQALKKLNKSFGTAPTKTQSQVLNDLDTLVKLYQAFVSRKPFILASFPPSLPPGLSQVEA